VPRLDARLTNPYSVFRDETGNSLYFTDEIGIRKIVNSQVHLPKLRANTERFRGIEINRLRKDMGPVFVADLGAQSSISFPGSIISVDDNGGTKSLKYDILISPVALAMDSKGNIFIADYVANRILVIYANGVLKALAGTGVWGDNNLEVNGSMANFRGPAGIAIEEKDGKVVSLYISDSQNDKVKLIKVE